MARSKACDTQQKVSQICELVAEGKTIREIAKQLKCSPGNVMRQVAEQPYSEQYARARDAAADLFEADILAAANAVTPETATADRVKIDALKWVAARRAPKRYGDRVQQEITGKDGGPIETKELSDHDKARRIAFLLSRGVRACNAKDKERSR